MGDVCPAMAALGIIVVWTRNYVKKLVIAGGKCAGGVEFAVDYLFNKDAVKAAPFINCLRLLVFKHFIGPKAGEL